MKRVFIKKLVTAGMFVAVLFAGAYYNVRSAGDEVLSSIKKDVASGETIETVVANTEDRINDEAFLKYACIESYGYVQRLLGKKEENDFEVIKDDQGSLHLSYFETGEKDTAHLAKEVRTFKDRLRNQDTKVLYVMTPDKYIKGYTTMEKGLPYNYANETADALLKELSEAGIDSIDLREGLAKSNLAFDQMFFKTDHHWTIEAAFVAYGTLLQELSDSYGFPAEDIDYYTDIDNYNVVTYKDSYVGSLGRKTGTLYSGVDDFSLIYPKFDTDYVFTGEINDMKIQTSGKFDESLLNLAVIRSDAGKYAAETDRYSAYLYGHQAVTHIQNTRKKDGPKVLICKDSYIVPVAAFLSTVCSDVYLVDPRYYEGDISEYANSINGLDYALISYYPQDLTDEFFRLNEEAE